MTPRYSRWLQPLIQQIYCAATTFFMMIVRIILHHDHHHPPPPQQQQLPPPPLPRDQNPTSIDFQPTTPFPHVSQRYHWDCGVACLQMIFTWLSFNNHNQKDEEENTGSDDLREWMIETIQTESIWTIDLVYLLHEFCQQQDQQQQQRKLNDGSDENVEHTRKCDRISFDQYSKFTYVMMTKSSLLVNDHRGDNVQESDRNDENKNNGDSDNQNNCDNYIHLPYYKDTWVQDRIRMQQRLHHMANSSTTISSNRSGIRQTSAATNSSWLSMEQVIHSVQDENCVALALVDTTIFTETDFVSDTITTTSTNDDPPKHSSTDHHDSHTYVGHYIIIAGISSNREHMSLLPPPQASRGMTSYRHSDVTGSSSTHYGCLVIYNPASTTTVTQPQYVDVAHFERAWRAYGTDEDIILITKS